MVRLALKSWTGTVQMTLRDPLNWSPARKWAIIALVSAITFNTYVV